MLADKHCVTKMLYDDLSNLIFFAFAILFPEPAIICGFTNFVSLHHDCDSTFFVATIDVARRKLNLFKKKDRTYDNDKKTKSI